MKIFLDDERVPVEQGWTIARNSEEFRALVEAYADEIVELSFDHDLGSTSESGMWCLRFLIEQMMNGVEFGKLEIVTFHSANMVGCENMLSYAESAADNVPAVLGICFGIQSCTNTVGRAKMPDDFDWDNRD